MDIGRAAMNSKYVTFTGIDDREYVRGPAGQFPKDETNSDYRTFLEWIAEGNQPEPWNN